MYVNEIINFPILKLATNDIEVDFEIEVLPLASVESDQRKQEINQALNAIEEQLSINSKRVEELNKNIEKLTNHADGTDYMVAVGSGILAGLIDSLWVGEFNMERGKAWSNQTVNKFVMKVAESQGFEGDRLKDAIKFLEDKFHIPSDNIWKGENVGISARSHHLDDLAHHPTPLGLFFSILTQFTKKGYFQNSNGNFIPIEVGENGKELIGNDIPSKIFAGTINWFFHLVSDMSGSNKTAGAGMGIPGPIVSLLKELSLVPGLNKTELPKKIKEIFTKEKFDLRSELAVGFELGRQAVPILINEVIVRAFYFIRRLVKELKEKNNFKEIEWTKTLPLKNRTIVRMLTISTCTFTLIDLADAAIRGAINSGGNKAIFAKEFILRVNFVGVGRFAIAITSDIKMGVKESKLRNERMAILSQQLHLMNAKINYLQADLWITAETTEKAINEVFDMMENTTEIFIQTLNDNRQSLNNIDKYKNGIQNKNLQLIEDITNILTWGE